MYCFWLTSIGGPTRIWSPLAFSVPLPIVSSLLLIPFPIISSPYYFLSIIISSPYCFPLHYKVTLALESCKTAYIVNCHKKMAWNYLSMAFMHISEENIASNDQFECGLKKGLYQKRIISIWVAQKRIISRTGKIKLQFATSDIEQRSNFVRCARM